jgi:allantoicase
VDSDESAAAVCGGAVHQLMCLLQAREPGWCPDSFTDSGKWMDGWETQRRRIPGHDLAVVRLGQCSRATERDNYYYYYYT